MSRYRKVDPKMWGDAKFRALTPPPPCGQSLFQYLLTCREHTNVPGVLNGGKAHFAEALGWPLEGFLKAFGEVLREGLAKADWGAQMVWLPNSKKYNVPESPNVVLSWRTAWDEVPECALKLEAYHALKAFTEGLGKAFGEAFAKACAKPSPKALANQEQDQDQDQDQEQNTDSVGNDQKSEATARKKHTRCDIDASSLTRDEKAAHDAIVSDPSLQTIVEFPAQTSRDLVAAGPGVDVPYQVRKAGSWLRANPTKKKKNGAKFLLGWISRQQENGGGTQYARQPEQHPTVAADRRVRQTELALTPNPEALSPSEQAAMIAEARRAAISQPEGVTQ
jgi:hypothetical protein